MVPLQPTRHLTLRSALAASLLLLATGCGFRQEPRILVVPAEYSSIQEAVDQARPHDIVEVTAGIYHEAVAIETDGIVIRGADRNEVILDGRHLLANGIYVAANGVRVENLTVHSYTQNGIIFSGMDVAANQASDREPGTPGNSLVGYEVGWVTAYNNGLYGIYAFAASDGVIHDSLVSGHPDSGIYVGQCKPCRAIVRNVTAISNGMGYYGTNASGDVYVIESTFRGNRLGVAPNSQRAELLFPQEETVVAGNIVDNNDNPLAPAISEGFFGGGIIVGGGTKNVIIKNRVTGHSYIGIGIIPFNDFDAENNRVTSNVSINNDIDLAYVSRPADSSVSTTPTRGNCFSSNTYVKSDPSEIEDVLPCGATAKRFTPPALPQGEPPPDVDYKSIAAPAPQPVMPATEFARRSGVVTFAKPDLDKIRLP